jgi:hypothetical protein
VKVNDVVPGGGACAVEITIVENRDASIAKNAYGREFVSVVAHTLQALATTHAEESTPEAGLLVEAGTASLPSATVPFPAWWPRRIRLGLPPVAAISIIATSIAVVTVATGFSAVADDKYGAATLCDPQAFAIHTPSPAFNTRGAADLALKSDLIGTVTAAILAILVVGLAFEGLLSCRKCRYYEKNESKTEEANECPEFHERAPIR